MWSETKTKLKKEDIFDKSMDILLIHVWQKDIKCCETDHFHDHQAYSLLIILILFIYFVVDLLIVLVTVSFENESISDSYVKLLLRYVVSMLSSNMKLMFYESWPYIHIFARIFISKRNIRYNIKVRSLFSTLEKNPII